MGYDGTPCLVNDSTSSNHELVKCFQVSSFRDWNHAEKQRKKPKMAKHTFAHAAVRFHLDLPTSRVFVRASLDSHKNRQSGLKRSLRKSWFHRTFVEEVFRLHLLRVLKSFVENTFQQSHLENAAFLLTVRLVN